MKLTKALKLKNSLVGEVTTLKNIIIASNVTFAKNTPEYDSKTKYSELLGKIQELASHKAKIAAANSGIYPQMFLLAEYKGLIEHLRSLNTKDGVEPAVHREAVEIVYKASIKDSFVNEEVARLTKEIEKLQDEIDEYNTTHSIDN